MERINLKDLNSIIKNEDGEVKEIQGTPFFLSYEAKTMNYFLHIGRTVIGKRFSAEDKCLEQLNSPTWDLLSQIIFALSRQIANMEIDERLKRKTYTQGLTANAVPEGSQDENRTRRN